MSDTVLQFMGSYHGKSMKKGGGGRFAKLKSKLARKGSKSPGGLAAKIGRKKHGNAMFQHLAAKGKKRAARKR